MARFRKSDAAPEEVSVVTGPNFVVELDEDQDEFEVDEEAAEYLRGSPHFVEVREDAPDSDEAADAPESASADVDAGEETTDDLQDQRVRDWH